MKRFDSLKMGSLKTLRDILWALTVIYGIACAVMVFAPMLDALNAGSIRMYLAPFFVGFVLLLLLSRAVHLIYGILSDE